ncbi:hypothetical protein BJV82DRAFT_620759 [Fennellomyces sp. T-0311]|nr:hypothetical protein BJV82DRAFT_620759 [Fennellomyces sp. T-0311]
MELMAVGAVGPGWRGTADDIQFKQLRTLRLEKAMTHRLAVFLRRCVNLENLDLLSIMDDINQRQLFQAITSLRQLRSLRLHYASSRRIAVQDRSWGFDLFAHHPVLE